MSNNASSLSPLPCGKNGVTGLAMNMIYVSSHDFNHLSAIYAWYATLPSMRKPCFTFRKIFCIHFPPSLRSQSVVMMSFLLVVLLFKDLDEEGPNEI